MQISRNVEAPANYRKRHSYAALTSAITAESGNWVSVPLADLPGSNNALKQSAVIQAAKSKGLRVDTTCQGDQIYIRLRTERR